MDMLFNTIITKETHYWNNLMSDHLESMHLHSGDNSTLTLIKCPCRRPVSQKRTVSNYVLTVPEPPWDLGDLEYPYQPSFKLDPRVLVVP